MLAHAWGQRVDYIVSEWAHACGQRWIRGIQRLGWGTGSRSNMGLGFHLRRMERLWGWWVWWLQVLNSAELLAWRSLCLVYFSLALTVIKCLLNNKKAKYVLRICDDLLFLWGGVILFYR